MCLSGSSRSGIIAARLTRHRFSTLLAVGSKEGFYNASIEDAGKGH
ncbi:hypothetical protein X765_20655 [Mesorhizobium sp. LSHC440B00]|nr:hypothetical protein X765_20655 [Mesorhizobium sp. LSHC440B00]